MLIGGAVVAAMRRSAGLGRSGLARRAGVPGRTLADWETGRVPLFAVPYRQLCCLARAVSPAGAQVAVALDELLVAGQCDLLLREMLSGTADYAELPPIGTDTAAGLVGRELLTWAFLGVVPCRYRRVSRPGCLYPRSDRQQLAAIVGELTLGGLGRELAGYASELAALISQGHPASSSGSD